ncbi:RHS repeat-associated core domain-containing protein [Streptomyces sp. BE303]|uniref:RHS repeat-associated core domain-containing protein n=1 Tax=Streptomyces sp. BE303 TaxID=3002528 RepID=UPI002E790C9A|nr:RHS repeat-associated core domain-containing protein [Streptomyces sp. BE303]MED7953989.1 polymorphic toxin-type HINT domain-containing protein [Streptomyces sp. BE303]
MLSTLAVVASLVVPAGGIAFAAAPDYKRVWSPPNTPLPGTVSVTGSNAAPPAPARAKRSPAAPPVDRSGRPAPTGTAAVELAQAPADGTTSARSDGRGNTLQEPAAGASSKAGDLPVWLSSIAGAGNPAPATRTDRAANQENNPKVSVALADATTAKAAGVNGALISLSLADQRAGVKTRVSLDPVALAPAYGGDWAGRTTLAAMPACALTSPGAEQCRTRTPVPSHYDPQTRKLVADVDLPPAAPSTSPLAKTPSTSAADTPAAPPATVLALTSTPGGGAGSYSATSLAPSQAWSAGGSSGSFTYNYPVQVPPSLGGGAPQIGLSYDSSSIDGKTSATNSQASWIGEGWDLGSGFVERSYQPCSKAGIDKSGDQCWSEANLTLSLAGHSGQLVPDDGSCDTSDPRNELSKCTWRLQADDGTKVQFLTGATNGTWNGSYLKVTDTSGTVFYFGLNHLPTEQGAPTTTGPENRSAWTVPVYSPKPGDPCYDPAKGNTSWCHSAWRWNLDHIVDVHGNLTTYTYAPETNVYARGAGQNNGTGTNTEYTRAGNLQSVAYGQRLSDQLTANGTHQPAAQIVFDTGERCTAGENACRPEQRTPANAGNWPDVPTDQQCSANDTCANTGPSYWTTRWLTAITTKVRVNGEYRTVDSYKLTHGFEDPHDYPDRPNKDPNAPAEELRIPWLVSIQRTAESTRSGQNPVTLKPVTFAAMLLRNRVDGPIPARSDFFRPRIQFITTETGGTIGVDYFQQSCSRNGHVMPSSPDTNTLPCYNVKWYEPNPPHDANGQPVPVDDWFLRYPVKSVTVDPRSDFVRGSLTQTTSYTYGPAAWHRNDAQGTDTAVRTWDQFRGFASVTAVTGSTEDGPQSKTATYYHQGMHGDLDAAGNARNRTLQGPTSGPVTDHDWLAGQVLESDTYADATADTPTASSVNTSANPTGGEPATTATHSRGPGLPALKARYAAPQQSTVTARARKADGSWRTTTDTTFIDETVPYRPSKVLQQADGTPDVCVRTKYAANPSSPITNAVAQTLTVSGPNACDATPTAANTVSGGRTLFDNQPFENLGTVASATSIQVLEKYDTGGTAQWTTTGHSAYDAYGRPTTVTDPTTTDTAHPNGAATTTVYASAAPGELPNKNLITAPAPAGTPEAATGWTSTVTLDPTRSLPLTTTDANGRTVTQTYDALGRLTAVWQAGRTTAEPADYKFTYRLTNDGPSSITTETLRATKTYHQSVQILDGLARVVQTQSDPALSAYAGRMITDTYYDTHGRATRLNNTYYNGLNPPSTTRFEPDDAKVPNQTRNVYDGMSRVVASEFRAYGVLQSTTSTSYPGADRVDVTPPTGGRATSTVTDSRGRTLQLWQYRTPAPTGNPADADVTSYAYSQLGTQTSRTDAAGNTWTYGYDQRGRRTSADDPDAGASTTSYDAAGRIASTTDARGQSIVSTYDLLGRSTGTYKDSVSPANRLTARTYDTVAKGKPASSTRYVGGQSGAAYTTAVTAMDTAYQPTKSTVTIPGSEVGQTNPLTFTYQAVFNPITGAPTKQGLPAMGDLFAETVTYNYESYGLLHDIGGLGGIAYDVQSDYDAYGRNIRSTMNPYGTQIVTTNTFDESTGRRLSQFVDKQTATTGSVQQTTYAYNQVGRITAVRTIPNNTPAATDLQCFGYDYLGRLTTAWTDTGRLHQEPNPTVGGRGACANATPTSGAQAPYQTTVGGSAPYWQSYQYDLTGNRTGMVAHDPGGDTSSDVTTTQTFPAPGTRNTPTTAPGAGGGTGGPHALLTSSNQAGGNTPTTSTSQYDAAGHTTAITDTAGTTTLTWNGEDRLESLTTTGHGATTYLYDADGNQLIRRNPGKTTINLGNGDELVYNTVTKALNGTRYYPIPGGTTLVRQGGNELTYQFSDHHGSGTLAINAKTLTENRRPSDPFGNPRGTQPSVWAGDHGFVGGTKDDVTGLTNLGARQYQPTTGRFLSLDPVLDPGDPQQWNGYAYSENDPVNKSDPSGLISQECRDYRCGQMSSVDYTTLPDPSPPFSSEAGTASTNSGGGGGSGGGAGGAASSQVNASAKKASDAKAKVIDVGKKLAKIVADELGITDAVNCVTTGDLGACGETALNVVSSMLSGGPLTKLLAKYAFRWNKAYELAKSIKTLASELFDGLKTWRRESKAAKEAEDAVTAACPIPIAVPHSFLPTTPVLLADGTTKPIGEVVVGDQVLATDPQTNTTSAETVTDTIVTPDDTLFTDLTLTSDAAPRAPPTTLTSTQRHPFWDTTTNRWTEAADLEPGHTLLTPDGTPATIQSTRSYQTTPTEARDLTVSTLHTYYVLVGATPVLIHNINDPNQALCPNPGQAVWDIPGGSSGSIGAGRVIPPTMRAEAGVGVQWQAPQMVPLCSYCRTNVAKAVDHVEPRINGGDLTDANTTPACTFCNSSKKDRVAPLNPPPNYSGQWPPVWWPANMQATVANPRTIP